MSDQIFLKNEAEEFPVGSTKDVERLRLLGMSDNEILHSLNVGHEENGEIFEIRPECSSEQKKH